MRAKLQIGYLSNKKLINYILFLNRNNNLSRMHQCSNQIRPRSHVYIYIYIYIYMYMYRAALTLTLKYNTCSNIDIV